MTEGSHKKREPGTAGRWQIFIGERFPLHLHLPVIAFITAANGIMAVKVQGLMFDPVRLASAFVIAALFFFRLRCFDEIKDYNVDIKLNPTRPLARGLLSVSQVRVMFMALTGLEVLIAGALGISALSMHLLAIAYSYLMYREFFIGRYIRPHLTTYAVTHTFVSVLLGLSIMSQMTNRFPVRFPTSLLLVALLNWALFNVFEFSRKTFAPEEETPGADSYSRRFGQRGAVALCLAQVAAAVLLLYLLPASILKLPVRWPAQGWVAHGALALLPLCSGILYSISPSRRFAAAYRTGCGLYQLLFYMLLTLQAGAGL